MRDRQRGFTLIEMLIVVAIIAIIATIATPRLQRAWQRANKTRTMADMRVLAGALDTYMADPNTGGSYPAGLQGTVAETIAPVIEPKLIAKCPRADQWGSPFQYISDSDGFGYSLISYGRDRRTGSREGAGGDAEFSEDIVLVNGTFVQGER